MEISKVTYSRTKKVNYDDTKCIEVSAEINSQDDANEVLLYLQNWVDEKLRIHETIPKLEKIKSKLEDEIFRLENNNREAAEKWNRVKQFLEKLGLDQQVDDIPF